MITASLEFYKRANYHWFTDSYPQPIANASLSLLIRFKNEQSICNII